MLGGSTVAALVVFGCARMSGGSTARGGPEGRTPLGIHYMQAGSGPAVVFLHGSGLDLQMWDDQVSVAARRFRVIRYDMTGHGTTKWPSKPQPGFADLRDILDELGVAHAALVGLSAGAQVAIDFALAYPARVDRLLLASPTVSGYVPRGSFEWFTPVADAARAGQLELAARRYAESSFLRIDGNVEQQARLLAVAIANKHVWGDTVRREGTRSPSAIGGLSGVRVPTLIVVGEHDVDDVQRVASLLIDSIPCARRIEIPASGHMVNMAAPTAFNEAMLGFLTAARTPCNRSRPS